MNLRQGVNKEFQWIKFSLLQYQTSINFVLIILSGCVAGLLGFLNWEPPSHLEHWFFLIYNSTDNAQLSSRCAGKRKGFNARKLQKQSGSLLCALHPCQISIIHVWSSVCTTEIGYKENDYNKGLLPKSNKKGYCYFITIILSVSHSSAASNFHTHSKIGKRMPDCKLV